MNVHTRAVISFLLASCLLCLPAASQKTASRAKPAAVSALNKTTFEAYIRHLFMWGPQVKVAIANPKPSAVPGMREISVTASAGEASVQQLFLVSSDGKKIVQGVVYDIADNPFRPEISKLNTTGSPSLGTPGAPVMMVLFTDFQCPYCRQEAKMLRQNLLAAFPKEVRLYFKDFPLEQMHPWAKTAAIAGRCLFQQNQEAFWQYHDFIFEEQPQVSLANFRAKLMDFAKGKSIDTMLLGRCLDAKATEAEVNKTLAEGRALQVNGTPTLFINGRRLPSTVQWEQLQELIKGEIEYQKTARNAGDQSCCEVTLASPLSK